MEPDVRSWPRYSRAVFVALATIMAATVALWGGNGEAKSVHRSPSTKAASSKSPVRLAAVTDHLPIDPDDFVTQIDNPLFPLKPGTVFHYRGSDEVGTKAETMTVTERTKEILGVTTTVIKDVSRLNGKLYERTYDWYAQDVDGNVWYLGEDASYFEEGEVVSKEGSWEAGVDGAKAGILINADPRVTDSYRQEFLPGEAEGMFWVVGVGESKTVPYGEFSDAVLTLEWSPTEPRIVGEKYYGPGVGLLEERALSGGVDVVKLIKVDQAVD